MPKIYFSSKALIMPTQYPRIYRTRIYILVLRCGLLGSLVILFSLRASSQQSHPVTSLPSLPAKFELPRSGLELARRTQAGTFYDIVGRRAAAYGYEHRGMEAWVHPLKIADDFRFAFRIEGYPQEFAGADILTVISVRPEATVFTYSHAAFTVRAHVFAPVDEPGVIILLDVDSTLPLTVRLSFRPRLALAWPAGLGTGDVDWDEKEHVYYLTENSQRFAGLIGSPGARDVSVQPYQEEPRDAPVEFLIEHTPEQIQANFIPIVITAASTLPITPTTAASSTQLASTLTPRELAKRNYDRLLANVRTLYERNVTHYAALEANTLQLATPDARLDEAFRWAKVGVEKGVATNPQLGTGLVAGFRTSGASERAGFAWFFGRDALWTALALNSYGDFATTRTALEFLRRFQRADGKIPHEISQSAGLIPWFTEYGYAFSSADATPLYAIVHHDLFNSTGDTTFLKANWDSIKAAYEFTARTDTDGNGLIENTSFGHGWVEGGALYPPHEEIYMQGLWIEASRAIAELADRMNDNALARRARANLERTRAATEQTFWLPEKNFYAYATKLPTQKPITAEPGANRPQRQARSNELAPKRLYDEDTVLPAVALWWRTLDAERAQTQLDHLGSARLATDWGARIIANDSQLYDPLSYHHGSVWALFTGWTSIAAYAHGRAHIGRQALMANALLTYPHALGYVTELLSGDFNTPFGRSSHHQIWSEAMVATPVVRGLLGLETRNGGREFRFAPQLPADWDKVEVLNVPAGESRFDLALRRTTGATTVSFKPRFVGGVDQTFVVAPALPRDARVRTVTINNVPTSFEVKTEGDVQRVETSVQLRNTKRSGMSHLEIVFTYDEGTDVFVEYESLAVGNRSTGLRVIRSRADEHALHLVLEGIGGKTYSLGVRTGARIGAAEGVSIAADNTNLRVTFNSAPGIYARREITIPLSR